MKTLLLLTASAIAASAQTSTGPIKAWMQPYGTWALCAQVNLGPLLCGPAFMGPEGSWEIKVPTGTDYLREYSFSLKLEDGREFSGEWTPAAGSPVLEIGKVGTFTFGTLDVEPVIKQRVFRGHRY